MVEVGSRASRWASVVASDPESVRSAARAFGACIVQRQVRGDVLSFGGVATDVGLLGFLVSRYIRTWPAAGGNVSFSEAIAPPPGLADRVAALVAGLEWQGIFELELIATESGEFAAIDFNPRVYGSLGLAVASGAPLPAIWCGWLVGRSPAPAGVQAGWRYRWEDADLRHLAWCMRKGRVGCGLAIATPRRKVAHAYFQLRDPVPAIARGVQLVGKAGERARVHEQAREASIVPLASIEDSRDEWTALAERSGNIFSTWEWARVWWNHFGAGKRLELSAVRHGQRTAAIVPLHAQRWAGVRMLRFVGHGPGDQLGPVCDPFDLPTASAGLARIASRGEVLLAERLPREREWADELRGSVLSEESSPLIDLIEEGDWESYLQARSQNFRQQVRRRARRLQRSLGLSFRLTEDADQLESDFDALVKLHAARWGMGSAAFSESRQAFHREFASCALVADGCGCGSPKPTALPSRLGTASGLRASIPTTRWAAIHAGTDPPSAPGSSSTRSARRSPTGCGNTVCSGVTRHTSSGTSLGIRASARWQPRAGRSVARPSPSERGSRDRRPHGACSNQRASDRVGERGGGGQGHAPARITRSCGTARSQ